MFKIFVFTVSTWASLSTYISLDQLYSSRPCLVNSCRTLSIWDPVYAVSAVLGLIPELWAQNSHSRTLSIPFSIYSKHDRNRLKRESCRLAPQQKWYEKLSARFLFLQYLCSPDMRHSLVLGQSFLFLFIWKTHSPLQVVWRSIHFSKSLWQPSAQRISAGEGSAPNWAVDDNHW